MGEDRRFVVGRFWFWLVFEEQADWSPRDLQVAVPLDIFDNHLAVV